MFNKAAIEKYFIAEKNESLVFIAIGVAAIVVALIFLFYHKSAFYRGFAIPLLVVALIQIAVGYTVYKRSDKDRTDNVYAFDLDPGKLKNEEIPRMEMVLKNFVVYRWVEISLAIAGLLLILFFRTQTEQSFWYGLGMGLAIQSLIMFIADLFAEKRAHEYFNGLRSFFNL